MILHSRQNVHNAYFFLQNTRKPRTLARVKAPGTPPTLSSSVLPRTMMVLQSGGGDDGDDGDDGDGNDDGDDGDGGDGGGDGDDGDGSDDGDDRGDHDKNDDDFW